MIHSLPPLPNTCGDVDDDGNGGGGDKGVVVDSNFVLPISGSIVVVAPRVAGEEEGEGRRGEMRS
jgi:hypothetical protein